MLCKQDLQSLNFLHCGKEIVDPEIAGATLGIPAKLVINKDHE
jgi:hypothetical protein